MSGHELEAFLETIPRENWEVAAALRATVRRSAPDAEDSLLWGTLSYHRPWVGGRVKGAVCQIDVVRGEVRLEFIHGVRLDDPRQLLRGDRLSKRYVPIHSAEEAGRPQIAELIQEAATLELPDIG